MDEERLAYIELISPYISKRCAEIGMFASIVIAQAAIESRNGTSTLAVNANNHFGRKYVKKYWDGGYYIHRTREYFEPPEEEQNIEEYRQNLINDGFEEDQADPGYWFKDLLFCQYENWEQGFEHYLWNIFQRVEYENVREALATRQIDVFLPVLAKKYATDKRYQALIEKVILEYDLRRFDNF